MQVEVMPGLERTRNHWWRRPGWAVGRRAYAWHLTFEHAPELHHLADAVRPTLAAHPHTTDIPNRWLHLTITADIGFTDQVSDAQLADLRDRVLAQLPPRPVAPLAYRALLVADEGVCLDGEPAPWLMALSRAQRDACDAVLGPRGWGGQLWPHTSLCYFEDGFDPRPLRDSLQPLVAPVDALRVANPVLTLMRMHSDTHLYQWEPLLQVPLGVTPGR